MQSSNKNKVYEGWSGGLIEDFRPAYMRKGLMDDFGFGFLLGIVAGIGLLFLIAGAATAGRGNNYYEAEIELGCRQELNQTVASQSAEICPAIIKRLESNADTK